MANDATRGLDHDEESTTAVRLPMMGLSGLVLLPHMLVGLRVTDRRSQAAVQAAMASGERLFLVPQTAESGRPRAEENDDDDELPEASSHEAAGRLGDEASALGLGVIASIEQLVPLDGGELQVALHGQSRAKLGQVIEQESHLVAEIEPLPDPAGELSDAQAAA
ncbi:MAG TPA: LON peptidase substrate-binding domain-containing protein, partial [Limnochordia bacterium]|nr:LON peptidase substrate-binding domain-containing protein [Limnochordia bacterium]